MTADRETDTFSRRIPLIVAAAFFMETLDGTIVTTAPAVPMPVIYGVLFAAGMTRSMNCTSTSTLAFADVSAKMRPSATTLAAMTQQAANAVGVAAAVLALAVFQASRSSTSPALPDFQYALVFSAR